MISEMLPVAHKVRTVVYYPSSSCAYDDASKYKILLIAIASSGGIVSSLRDTSYNLQNTSYPIAY